MGRGDPRRPDRVTLDSSFVFTVILCSVLAGALAGFAYWFFSRLVDGWGFEQLDFLADFGVELFGFELVDMSQASSPLAGVFVTYGYLTFAPVIGAAAGAVMSLLAIDARRGAGPRWMSSRPSVAVSAPVLITAVVTALLVYPIVQSLLVVAYIAAIGGAGLLFVLLRCVRFGTGGTVSP
jgi:hypothetical protein